MDIKHYTHNDPELLSLIVEYLGNPEWQKEHDMPLMRYPSKVFHLLFDNDVFVAMFSTNKTVIGDCHTKEEHRGKGYMTYLLTHSEFKPGAYAMTRSDHMAHILESIGFEAAGNNGRFTKYRKAQL